MMDIYDQYSPTLLDDVRAARQRGWWREFGLAGSDYVGWEDGASHVHEVSVSRIPDLLQTQEYSSALLADSCDIESALTLLKRRQCRLIDENQPLRLSVILNESSLHNNVANLDIMRTQIDHLHECISWPTVSIQILPANVAAHVNVNSFRLLDFDRPEDPPVVFADTAFGFIQEDHGRRTTSAKNLFGEWAESATHFTEYQHA